MGLSDHNTIFAIILRLELTKALSYPFEWIAKNAGVNGSVVSVESRKNGVKIILHRLQVEFLNLEN